MACPAGTASLRACRWWAIASVLACGMTRPTALACCSMRVDELVQMIRFFFSRRLADGAIGARSNDIESLDFDQLNERIK